MSIRTAERLIRAELRKKFGPRYHSKFEIRTSESNRALSVHWRGEPDEAVIQATGKAARHRARPSDGVWFFQTVHNE